MFRLVRDKVTFMKLSLKTTSCLKLTENHNFLEEHRLFQQNENPGRREEDGSGAEKEEQR